MATNEENTNVQSSIIITKAVHVPTDADVDHWLSEIDGLVTELGTYTQALTSNDRRRMLKVRRGGERHIEQVAKTAARYGLAFPGGSLEELQAHMEVANKLMPVLARLQAATEVVSDTILRSRNTTWKATTSAYTMLSRMAKNVPSIATEIAGATELFARKAKSTRAAASPAVSNGGDTATKPTGAHPGAQPSGGDAAPVNNGLAK
jgi:hypothetical protein